MIYSLDIETESKPKDELPKGIWDKYGKDCALYPQFSNITVIGVTSEACGLRKTFRCLSEFKCWDDENQPDYVGHRLTFDLDHLWFRNIKIPLDRYVDDTQVMFHIIPEKVQDDWLKRYNEKRVILNKQIKGGNHRAGTKLGLKTLAPYFLRVKPFWEDPSNHDSDEYVLKDCEYTEQLRTFGLNYLEGSGHLGFYRDQMEKNKMLFEMKQRGIGLNKEVFEVKEREYLLRLEEVKLQLDEVWRTHHETYYLKQCSEIIADSNERCKQYIKNRIKTVDKIPGVKARYEKSAENKISKLDRGINYNSDDQMLWLLRDQLGYDVTNYEGKESTGVEVLEKLSGEGKQDVQLFLKYREVSKIITSYFPTYRALARDWRLHPDFNLTGTRTGRLSSSNPNLQQVPAELYCLFAPTDGYSFLDYDEAAIEGKLIGLYSEDQNLVKIDQSGESLHDYRVKYSFFPDDAAIQAADIKDIKPKFKPQRDATKNCGFANFYGAGSKRIAITLTKAGFPTSLEKANQIWKTDKEFFSGVTEFHRAITKEFEKGKVINNIAGRPIAIENKRDCYMKGFNTLIQSSASDLVLDACYKALQEYRKLGLRAFPLALIHDAIIVEAHDDDLDQAEKILIDKMTCYDLQCSLGRIELTVEGKRGKVWEK